MQTIDMLPDMKITKAGDISKIFLDQGVDTFLGACHRVHQIPYGYNSNRDDVFLLFEEGKGTCTTKHAVIATLAQELDLPVVKQIGIYAMTEQLVTGTQSILKQYNLRYLPMVHCFLVSGAIRVDLTEGNHNGKNGPIDAFIFTQTVAPQICEKDEYLLYRKTLTDVILHLPEFKGLHTATILKARQAGLALLKANISEH